MRPAFNPNFQIASVPNYLSFLSAYYRSFGPHKTGSSCGHMSLCILSETSRSSFRIASALSGVRLPRPQDGVMRH